MKKRCKWFDKEGTEGGLPSYCLTKSCLFRQGKATINCFMKPCKSNAKNMSIKARVEMEDGDIWADTLTIRGGFPCTIHMKVADYKRMMKK